MASAHRRDIFEPHVYAERARNTWDNFERNVIDVRNRGPIASGNHAIFVSTLNDAYQRLKQGADPRKIGIPLHDKTYAQTLADAYSVVNCVQGGTRKLYVTGENNEWMHMIDDADVLQGVPLNHLNAFIRAALPLAIRVIFWYRFFFVHTEVTRLLRDAAWAADVPHQFEFNDPVGSLADGFPAFEAHVQRHTVELNVSMATAEWAYDPEWHKNATQALLQRSRRMRFFKERVIYLPERHFPRLKNLATYIREYKPCPDAIRTIALQEIDVRGIMIKVEIQPFPFFLAIVSGKDPREEQEAAWERAQPMDT